MFCNWNLKRSLSTCFERRSSSRRVLHARPTHSSVSFTHSASADGFVFYGWVFIRAAEVNDVSWGKAAQFIPSPPSARPRSLQLHFFFFFFVYYGFENHNLQLYSVVFRLVRESWLLFKRKQRERERDSVCIHETVPGWDEEEKKKCQNIDIVRVRKEKARQRQTYVNKAGREKGGEVEKAAECWTVDLSPQLLAKSVICSTVESTSGEHPA